MEKLRAGVLGASGFLGRNFVERLQKHPLFSLTFVAGSPSSLGKRLSNFLLEDPYDIPNVKKRVDVLFSALPSATAKTLEEEYIRQGTPVFTSASYRFLEKPQLLIPEINPELVLQETIPLIMQPKSALQNFLLPLYPLHKRYAIKTLQVVALQSVNSAGSSFPAGRIVDNVIPYIAEEEEIIEQQLAHILGISFPFAISCSRIAASYGNMAFVSVSFVEKPEIKDVIQIWKRFTAAPQYLKLPSAASKPILFFPEKDRPQLKEEFQSPSMAVSVGKLEKSALFDLRFCASSHSLFRGKVGATILAAELYHAKKHHPQISAFNLQMSSFAK